MEGLSLHPKFLLIAALAWCACACDLHAQTTSTPTGSRNAPVAADGDEGDDVGVVEIKDTPKPGATMSGEQEGLGDIPDPPEAPEQAEPDKEQKEPKATPGIDIPPNAADQVNPGVLPGSNSRSDAATETHATSRTNARTMSLLIPAPRSLILDRNGVPLAQTRVAYQFAIRFGQFADESPENILKFAHKCMDEARKISGGDVFEIKDAKLLEYYENRRWLPLPITNVISAEDAEKMKSKVAEVTGLELLPIYARFYPEKESAAHILGYCGAKAPLPYGPINHMDPLWIQEEGKSGLELKFDAYLGGKPGVWRLMFDEQGTKILDELQVKPKPGGTLVTTINLKWQKEAERLLNQGKHRGAMVVLDCQTGEVLVMASTPSFDPNTFKEDYKKLRTDPGTPLLSRAFQGVYPPASTFKIVTVLAALGNGTLTENQQIYCGAAFQVGNHTVNNWSKTPLGSINCITGIAQSNNPFMCQAALNLDGRRGANAPLSAKILTDMARRLGYGTQTGLPIADKAGLVPTPEYMQRRERRNFTQGDVAVMAIGQGPLLATPLQVAHAVAGIANGNTLPKLQLVKQIQDENANVIYQCMPEEQTSLAGLESAAETVRKGMKAVVEGGTASRAKLSYVSMAGKTGTAQWGNEKENRRLAWFAGFLPYEKPKFAFVVLYEGRPNEKLGGSAAAAPTVKSFFENMKADVKAILKPETDTSIPMAEPVEEVPATPSANGNGNQHRSNGSNGSSDGSSAVPVRVVPGDVDDSADRPNIEVGPAPASDLIPRPGDADYIPGLDEQIPRHLAPQKQQPQNPVQAADPNSDSSDIPLAEPVVE